MFDILLPVNRGMLLATKEQRRAKRFALLCIMAIKQSLMLIGLLLALIFNGV